METYLKTFADEDNPDRPCSPPPTSWYPISTYRGFEYFQEQLAKQGIIAISVNFVKIDDAKINDHDKNEDDITNRARAHQVVNRIFSKVRFRSHVLIL